MARKQLYVPSPGITATLGCVFVALGLFGVFFNAPADWAGVAWLVVGTGLLFKARRECNHLRQDRP